jgi:uncharacterized membrane protein YhaH (DUF805 family)
MTPWKAVAGYLAGRCARPEYWISFAVLSGLNLLFLKAAYIPFAALLATAWLILAVRRLRDIGRSPWLCLTPVALSLVLLIAGSVIAGSGDAPLWLPLTFVALVLASWIGFWLVIGFPGSKPVIPVSEIQAEVFG